MTAKVQDELHIQSESCGYVDMFSNAGSKFSCCPQKEEKEKCSGFRNKRKRVQRDDSGERVQQKEEKRSAIAD